MRALVLAVLLLSCAPSATPVVDVQVDPALRQRVRRYGTVAACSCDSETGQENVALAVGVALDVAAIATDCAVFCGAQMRP